MMAMMMQPKAFCQKKPAALDDFQHGFCSSSTSVSLQPKCLSAKKTDRATRIATPMSAKYATERARSNFGQPWKAAMNLACLPIRARRAKLAAACFGEWPGATLVAWP